MVVSGSNDARMHFLRLLAIAVAIATANGCAAPWLKSANETELPMIESQAPKVYSKATATRPTNAASANPAQANSAAPANSAPPAKAIPSDADQRMAREIERLTRLNEQLSKTVAQSAASTPQSQPAAARPVRNASHETLDKDLRSEFVELAGVNEQPATAQAPQKFSFSDDSAPPAEQTPAPIVEKTQIATEARLETPPTEIKLASPQGTEKPAANDVKPTGYQAGDWLKTRDTVIAQLQDEIAAARLDKARAAEVAHLETLLRMQYALAGRKDDAVRPVQELREPEQEFWRSAALGLSDLLASDRLANESRRYAVALKSLEEAESHLAAASSLTLRNIALCRKVQDFGVIDRFKSNDFTRNQEVLLYVEVRNFAAKQKDDHQYETELQGSFRVLDRSGASRAERTLPLDKQTCANLRRDYYIAYRLYIPNELAAGSYTLELTIEDKKGEKSNNALLDFNVAQ